MRSISSSSIEYDGKTYSLAQFGVASANYTEKGILHIDGDTEDSMTSASEDKLMKAITEEPDKVKAVFSGLADKLYQRFSESMRSSTLRSALTLYNDKEMKSQITDYKDDLKVMEDKLKKVEDRYYKQFSAMESAMSKLNSQSSSLASMLGSK
jgi:flagellar hook-associated protein 2